MGLDVMIKGLNRENTYHGGYIRFAMYRMNVANSFNKRLGELYKRKYYEYGCIFSKDEIKEIDSILAGHISLDNFLFHFDCEGKFTYKECKEIYNELNKLKVEDIEYNDKYTMHELWIQMFKYCSERRVNMRLC